MKKTFLLSVVVGCMALAAGSCDQKTSGAESLLAVEFNSGNFCKKLAVWELGVEATEQSQARFEQCLKVVASGSCTEDKFAVYDAYLTCALKVFPGGQPEAAKNEDSTRSDAIVKCA